MSNDFAKQLREGIQSCERAAKRHEAVGDYKLQFYYEGKADGFRRALKVLEMAEQ